MAANRWIVRVAAGAVLFGAGLGAGTWHERSVEAQNRFGQPKTVVHMVVYKFKPTSSKRSTASRRWPARFLGSRISG
jgi:hypothetical protein